MYNRCYHISTTTIAVHLVVSPPTVLPPGSEVLYVITAPGSDVLYHRSWFRRVLYHRTSFEMMVVQHYSCGHELE